MDMSTREDAVGVMTTTILFGWFAGVADEDEVDGEDIHPDDQDAMKEWLASDDGPECARDLAEKIANALDDAGFVIARS